MNKVFLLIIFPNFIFAQELNFQDIKGWENSDIFAQNIFDNFF